jgi:hypothetical protein
VVSLLFAIVVTGHAAAAGKLYRWVDERGEVHYSDRLPPEQVKQEHQEITEQGRLVEEVEKAKTAEQLAAEQRAKDEAAREKAEAERLRQERAQRDRILLDTYVSEQDILRARERNVSILDGTINLTVANLEKLRATVAGLKKDLAEQQPGSNASKQIESNLRVSEQQIVEFETFAATKRAEQENIKRKFDDDLQRFRELHSQR